MKKMLFFLLTVDRTRSGSLLRKICIALVFLFVIVLLSLIPVADEKLLNCSISNDCSAIR
jgi:hypothetical protein